MKNVILITCVASPYRFPVFEGLAEKYDFGVWFMSEKLKNRSWSISSANDYNFNHKLLKGVVLNFGTIDYIPFCINPDVCMLIEKTRPDVVIISGWDSLTAFMAFITCKLLGIKIIIWSGSTENELSWRRNLFKLPVLGLIRSCDALIAYGSRARKYLLKLGADPKRIFISYNTNDIDKYENQLLLYKKESVTLKKKLGFSKKKVILYYGQLIERKGPDLLMKAYAILRKRNSKVALLIVGDGIYRNKLEKLIRINRIHDVKILANPGDERISKYYAISTMFVLPSREEVWGLVVNEAMASGLPVVVSDVCGCVEDLVRNHVNGYIFKSENVKSLYLAMNKILINDGLCRKMGKESKKIIKNIHPSITVKKINAAISFALKKV